MQKIKAEWVLRISLGLMLLYSGYDIVMHPNAWTWAVRALPDLLSQPILSLLGMENYLRLQGGSELLLALVLLAWFLPRKIAGFAGLIVAIEMFAITLFVGLDAVTFRDIGLIGAGFALFIMTRETVTMSHKETVPASSVSYASDDDIIVEVFKHDTK
jgi:uncharacterized membrane protein YphA (DoxX/SURF4 family)